MAELEGSDLLLASKLRDARFRLACLYQSQGRLAFSTASFRIGSSWPKPLLKELIGDLIKDACSDSCSLLWLLCFKMHCETGRYFVEGIFTEAG